MQYDEPLIEARLIQRYKRFLADVRLPDGQELTVHCPNTGSMKRCAEAGSRVWLSDSHNPKRKYRYTWEWVEVDERYRACVNTARPNQLVGEALADDRIAALAGWDDIQREPKVEDGRLDFCLHRGDERCWIEVKSVTLLEQGNGHGVFPDAVTDRGRKHLKRLQALVAAGDRAVMCFCVPHEGIREVSAAHHIDPRYADALKEAADAGVEVMALGVNFSADEAWGMSISTPLPVRL